MKEKFKKSYLMKILIFILLLGGMALFSSIPIFLFNIDINSFSPLLKTIYLLSCDITYIVLVYLLYFKSINKDFINFFKNFMNNFEESFKYYFIGLLVMIVSNLIITFLFSEATAGNEEAIRSYLDDYPIYMLFSIAIYAPFIEEIIFRKSIKDIFLAKHNNKILKYLYILSSGLIFVGMHLLGQVTNPLDLLYLIPYSSLGITFALLYYKTDNIFSTISIHCMHNTITSLLYVLTGGI